MTRGHSAACKKQRARNRGSGIYFIADLNHQAEVDFFDFNRHNVRMVFTLEKSLPGWSGAVSISGDGKWLLYPQLDGSSRDLMMIENWRK